MKTLRPLVLKEEFFSKLEKELKDYFYKTIYAPLYYDVIDEIGEEWVEVYNAKEVNLLYQRHLLKKLVTGRIQYFEGKFYGEFDSKTSIAIKSLGGVYDIKRKVFYLPEKKLTDNIRIAIGTAFSKFERVHSKIIRNLDDIQRSIDNGEVKIYNPEEAIRKGVELMNKDLNATLAPLTIDVKMSEDLEKFITAKYGEDLEKYIKNWSIQSVQRLRERISANAFSGYRASNLVEEIIADYGVSERKAKFLARQETSLILSTFREGRYKEVGIEQYQWSTAGDNRVRDTHRHLQGKIFSWDSPPVIDTLGHRGHPGEAFGCRCVAKPVL